MWRVKPMQVVRMMLGYNALMSVVSVEGAHSGAFVKGIVTFV